MKKVFYSPSLNHEIVDVSGKYTAETVQGVMPENKRANDYQTLELADNESVVIEHGVALKVDRKAKQEQREIQKKQRVDKALGELKGLGLSTESIAVLTGARDAEIESIPASAAAPGKGPIK